MIQSAVAAQAGEEGLKLKAVIGYNGNGRGNMVWSPDQGYHNTLKVKWEKETVDGFVNTKYTEALTKCLILKHTKGLLKGMFKS